jgi:hypothetical protein
LSPAKLKDIKIDKANNIANVYVDIDQIPMLIGKNGQNIRLASKLTGFEIKVKKVGGMYDIDLSEFQEELEDIQPGAYTLFTAAGFSSALEIIEAYDDKKIEFDDLEPDTLKRIVEMLREGLEEAEEEEAEAEPEENTHKDATESDTSDEKDVSDEVEERDEQQDEVEEKEGEAQNKKDLGEEQESEKTEEAQRENEPRQDIDHASAQERNVKTLE